MAEPVKVERFSVRLSEPHSAASLVLKTAPDGSMVRYSDHAAALKAEEERRQEAERKAAVARSEAEKWWGDTTDYWYERTQELERRCGAANSLAEHFEAQTQAAEKKLGEVEADAPESEESKG